MNVNSKLLLIVVNDSNFFLSHRLPVAEAARRKGYDVHIATAYGEGSEKIVGLGFSFHPIQMSRSGVSLFRELRCLFSLYRLMRGLKPRVVHLVTIKPVLYGGMMARLARVPAVVAAVSGLGAIFTSDSFKVRIIRFFVKIFYKMAFSHPNLKVIFQNADDERLLVLSGVLAPVQCVRIRGSGVNLAEYSFVAESAARVVVMAARLLKDKGVMEYVEAARLLKSRFETTRFLLAGNLDSGNPTSLTEEDLQAIRNDGVVELSGFQIDMSAFLSHASLVVLPSYREGMPKVLLEAAACGRAVITTDVPGCRDAIEPGITGLLVPVKDAISLAKAIEDLLDDGETRRKMGAAGRRLAERAFDVRMIVDQHLSIYDQLDTACS